ncbi:MAG TPA: hypothetical protein DFS52_04900 [Myxococcales bacterium]|nr:hypothetical protein [Myxococcales bacterium]
MSTSDRKRATNADIEALTENVVGQIIDGELIALPRATARHNRLVVKLLGVLLPTFDDALGNIGGWIFLSKTELHLGDDVLVPDIVGWRGSEPAEIDEPFLTIAPDFICEVLSPSTASIDRGKKRAIYLREKVRHLWLVDPLARTLEVFERGDGNWILLCTHADEARVRTPPFEAVELDLLELWGETRSG